MSKAMTTAAVSGTFKAASNQQEAVSGSVDSKYMKQMDTSGSHAANKVQQGIRNGTPLRFDENKGSISPAGAPFTTDASKA